MPIFSSAATSAGRQVGAHERLTIGFNNEWYAQILTNILSYAPGDMPSAEALRRRLDEMIRSYPLLRAGIPNPADTWPRWDLIAIQSFDVASRILDKSLPRAEEHADYDDDRGAIIDLEMQHGHRHFDFRQGLLWTVTRYTSGPADAETNKLQHIAFTTHHVIADGVGAMRLAMNLAGDRGSALPPYCGDIPPSLEQTIRLRPGLGAICESILQLRILPRLPQFMKRRTNQPSPTYWPYAKPAGEQVDRTDTRRCQTRHLVTTISAPLVARCKAVGKANGVNTLNPTLCAAWAAACYITNPKAARAQDPVHITLCSPFSVRDPALGHPFATGNYVGEAETSLEISGEESFWNLAKTVSADVSAAKSSGDGVQFWALEKWLPSDQKTGKEAAFAAIEPPQYAIGNSVTVSNVGLVNTAKSRAPGVRGHVWAQNRSPFGSGIYLNMAGFISGNQNAEISISWGFKENGTATGTLSLASIRETIKVYQNIIEIVAGSPLVCITELRLESFAHLSGCDR